jgi:hypothetical protein
MSSTAGVDLIARCVGPGIALTGIAGFAMLSWVMAMIAVRALENLGM